MVYDMHILNVKSFVHLIIFFCVTVIPHLCLAIRNSITNILGFLIVFRSVQGVMAIFYCLS